MSIERLQGPDNRWVLRHHRPCSRGGGLLTTDGNPHRL